MSAAPQANPRIGAYARQLIDEDDVAAVGAVLRGDFLTTGPAVDSFERAFAARVGSPYAVVCSNGTAALHLAAMGLGLGPGDVVVVPSLTFVATANACRMTGADVLIADVDPHSGLLTAEHLRAALAADTSRRVRAVFAVHLNGELVDMPAIKSMADARGLRVVEDACHALGGEGRPGTDGAPWRVGACMHADANVFSFHPVKTIAMGEGGLVTTRDPELAERMRVLRTHGISRDCAGFTDTSAAVDREGRPNPWYSEMTTLGYNYRASDIHCALGQSQLSKLDGFLERRRLLAAAYARALAPLAPVAVPVSSGAPGAVARHLYPVLIDFDAIGASRAAVMGALAQRGVGTQVHYIPVHQQPYYQRLYGVLDLPGAQAYYRRVLSLPFHAGMQDADALEVASILAEVLQ